MVKENPNHIYFANRANAWLEIRNFNLCIEDCDQAIQIDPLYQKSYNRKAKALQMQRKFQDAHNTLNEGLKVDAEN